MKNDYWDERTLIIPAINPADFPAERLFDWLTQPRNPVFASRDPLVKMFIAAMLKGRKAEFVYIGGSTPGLPRIVTPSLVFQHSPAGRIYVAGYCHLRGANRVFAVDKSMVIWCKH